MKTSIPAVSVNAIEAVLTAGAGAAFAQATDPSADGTSVATSMAYAVGAIGVYVAFKGALKVGESLRSLCRSRSATPENTNTEGLLRHKMD